MSGIEIKEIDEVDPYRGEHSREGIDFRAVGRALGVTAFGMNVIVLEGVEQALRVGQPAGANLRFD